MRPSLQPLMDPQTAPSTHYQVLGITPSIIDTHHDPSSLLKRAYRRALLQNHPDKAARDGFSSDTPQTVIYTVDQIATALSILSSPRDRAAYDNSLRLARPDGRDPSEVGGSGSFQIGVETVDLDDLPYDEKASSWYRGCRCGNDRAYLFGEEDLDACADEGELMVGCQDCSLWLRVSFAVVEEDAPRQ